MFPPVEVRKLGTARCGEWRGRQRDAGEDHPSEERDQPDGGKGETKRQERQEKIDLQPRRPATMASRSAPRALVSTVSQKIAFSVPATAVGGVWGEGLQAGTAGLTEAGAIGDGSFAFRTVHG